MSDKYRVVLTCYDANLKVKPYADCADRLFDSHDAAINFALALAQSECENLNDGFEGVGCFEIDDCANNDVEVRWYEKKPVDRNEGSCDIDYVTKYNVYPLEDLGGDAKSYKYRGFYIDANAKNTLFAVEQFDTVLTKESSLDKALKFVDDFCLTFELEAKQKRGSLFEEKVSEPIKNQKTNLTNIIKFCEEMSAQKKTWAEEKSAELANKPRSEWTEDDWEAHNYMKQNQAEGQYFDNLDDR